MSEPIFESLFLTFWETPRSESLAWLLLSAGVQFLTP